MDTDADRIVDESVEARVVGTADSRVLPGIMESRVIVELQRRIERLEEIAVVMARFLDSSVCETPPALDELIAAVRNAEEER